MAAARDTKICWNYHKKVVSLEMYHNQVFKTWPVINRLTTEWPLIDIMTRESFNVSLETYHN